MSPHLRAFPVAALTLALAAASGCRCGGREEARPIVGPKGASVLATLPEGPDAPGPDHAFVFAERGGGVAWVVEREGRSRVVHGGQEGKAYETVGRVVLGPDGRRLAYAARTTGSWRMVVDGREGAAFDEVDDARFSPDGAHVAYVARTGDRWHVVVDGVAGEGARGRHELHGFTGDSGRIVFVERAEGEEWGELVLSDLGLASRRVVDGRASGVLFDDGRTRIAAVSERDGKQSAIVFDIDRPEGIRRGPAWDAVRGLAFVPGSESLAYFAERAGDPFLVLGEKEALLPWSDSPVSLPVGRRDGRGVGIVVVADGAVTVREPFTEGAGSKARYDEIEWLSYGGEEGSHAYAARRGSGWFIVVNGKEGPPFDRVVSPAFSPDGKRVVYRARKDNRRFVVVADLQARTLRQHPPYEQVFPVVFTRDGKSVAYGVKDGRELAWKVEPL